MVDTFYNEVNRAYGLHPDRIDYDQFTVDADGKTLIWIPDDKKIPIHVTRGDFGFWLYRRWPSDTESVSRMYYGDLGLTGYTSGTSQKSLGSSTVKALQQADKILPIGANLGNIELEDPRHSRQRTSERRTC